MNQGSWVVVTSFWKLSAVRETLLPALFGVSGTLVADTVLFAFPLTVADGARPAALSAGRAPTLGSLSPFCGLLPGLIDSRISSTHLLIASNVFAPVFLSTISPSLNSAMVGNDLTSFPAHKSPLATQSTLANLKL
ncbi:hypothetical protein KC342_g3 [Hortaea werneckii]|nr:hypothetical protein KC342_g3 [Hortaea werneckii]